MNPEVYETIRFVAGLGMLGLLSVAGLGALLIIGLSHDPDAWLDRHATYWRTPPADDELFNDATTWGDQ